MRLSVLFPIWFFRKHALTLNDFKVYNLLKWWFFFWGGGALKKGWCWFNVLWTLICKLFCDILVLERVHDYKICNRNLMQGRWKKCYKSLLTHWIATDYSKIVINNFKIQIKIQVCAGIGIFLSSMLNWMFDFLFHVQICGYKGTCIKVHIWVYIYWFLDYSVCVIPGIYMLYKACKTVFKIIFLYNPFVL